MRLLYEPTIPTPGSLWEHYNGNKYKVILLTNKKSTSNKYVPQVVYENMDGDIWSRPVHDWHRSFMNIMQ